MSRCHFSSLSLYDYFCLTMELPRSNLFWCVMTSSWLILIIIRYNKWYTQFNNWIADNEEMHFNHCIYFMMLCWQNPYGIFIYIQCASCTSQSKAFNWIECYSMCNVHLNIFLFCTNWHSNVMIMLVTRKYVNFTFVCSCFIQQNKDSSSECSVLENMNGNMFRIWLKIKNQLTFN